MWVSVGLQKRSVHRLPSGYQKKLNTCCMSRFCTHHWFIPNCWVVVEVVDLNIYDGARRKSDAVYSHILGRLTLYEWDGTVKSHWLLYTLRQVLQLAQVIPGKEYRDLWLNKFKQHEFDCMEFNELRFSAVPVCTLVNIPKYFVAIAVFQYVVYFLLAFLLHINVLGQGI